MIAVRVAVFLLGFALILATMSSSVRTLILPRGIPSRITRIVFQIVRIPFNVAARPSRAWEKRDIAMSFFSPIALLALLATWLVSIVAGYGAMFWAVAHSSVRQAAELSGSSVFTLGTSSAADAPTTFLSYTEAGVGPLMLALLITYLPSMYGAFSRREAAVASLEVWGGTPPSPLVLIERLLRIRGLDELESLWRRWNDWFVEVKESHTTLPAVAFFRSPDARHSWVTAGGALLDTAAIIASTLDRPNDPDAQLCLRSGWISLRTVAAYFNIDFPVDPAPGDPITIRREEYDHLVDRLVEVGATVRADRDQCWLDYTGWRVNYDQALVGLATLVMAPESPWSSDRELSQTPRWWQTRKRPAPVLHDTGCRRA